MNSRRSRFAPAVSALLETLEPRVVLSTTGAYGAGAAEVATEGLRHGPTKTTLSISAGTLGQPVTFTVTVRAPAASGAPQGTVRLTNHGTLIQTLTLSPMASQGGRYAYSQATYTLTPQPGAGALYFGRYTVDAAFTPSGAFSRSTALAKFTVGEPSFTTLSDGVQFATIAPGSGPAIQSGQTANVLYTGYLARTGEIFDDSSAHGGTPISFTLGAGQVVPGFDAGTTGMQVGESRMIVIPPSEGYGSTANGSIPANSTLLFVVTLESIS